jgi:WD40 repeat protein
MPTTRAARRSAAERQLLELPADVLGLVLYQLTLAHDIAAVAPTCRTLSDAAKIAMKLRPFSGEVVTLAGHTQWVWCVAAVPDGRIITGSDDHTVKVWRDGACVRTIQAHTDLVGALRAVAVLPGGARFVSTALDGTAKLWTLDGALERTFTMSSNVLCVAALPDGVHFVVGLGSGENEGEIRLYHVDGTLVHTFCSQTQNNDSVFALAVTPDGQHIISGSDDSLVKVWNVATKSLVGTCGMAENEDDDIGHTSTVLAVAVMPDGQRILSGAEELVVRVWLLDGTLQNTFQLHTNDVNALVPLPDNQHALSASEDRTVKLFNVNDGTVLRTFRHHASEVKCLALLRDGRRFVTGGDDGTARIFYHGLAPCV